MTKIPKDLAEQLYERYVATLMNPVSFEEMFTAAGDLFEVNDAVQWTYDNGIVVPAAQLSRLYGSQKKAADPNEPYDVGFHNGLEMAMFICDVGERVPVFMAKPQVVDLQPKIDKLSADIGSLQDALLAEKTSNAAGKADMAERHIAEIEKLKAELAAAKEELAKEAEETKVEEVEEAPAPKKKKGLLSKITGKK